MKLTVVQEIVEYYQYGDFLKFDFRTDRRTVFLTSFEIKFIFDHLDKSPELPIL